MSKDVLSQADGIVALKLTSSQDRDAIGSWIEGQGDKAQGKAMLASLPVKQRGEGVLWIPARGVLQDVTFPPKATFDSSRTPKRGEKRQDTTLKPLDLGALKDKMAKVEAETKANDPRALKSELAKANAELAKLRKSPIPASNQVEKINTAQIERAVTAAKEDGRQMGWADGYRAGDQAGFQRACQAVKKTIVTTLQDVLRSDFEVSYTPAVPPRAPKDSGHIARRDESGFPKPPSQVKQIPKSAGNYAKPMQAPAGRNNVDAPLQRIIDSIRWWNVFGISAPTHAQAAFIANYVHGSGTWSRYLSSLRSAGLIEPRGDLKLTADGSTQANDPVEAPTGSKLREIVLQKIDAPLARILMPLIDAYPNGLSHEDAAARSDYVAGSGTWSRYLSSLRSLDLIEKRGELKAQDWLFPGGL